MHFGMPKTRQDSAD